jgi:hypothetical protein
VADACGREERPRGRARAKSRARAAPGSEGERGGCTDWPNFQEIAAAAQEQRSRGNSQRKKKG